MKMPRLPALLALCFFGLSAASLSDVPEHYWDSGDGSAAHPYELWTVAHLHQWQARPEDAGKHFQLMADIDFEGAQWIPITSFSGTLIGNGLAIRNFTITCSEAVTGFFRILESSATIDGLRLVNTWVHNETRASSGSRVAVLCGENYGHLRDVEVVAGSVRATAYIALLAARNYGTIERCYAQGVLRWKSVSGDVFMGAVAGRNDGTISDSCAVVTLRAHEENVGYVHNIGGLCGYNTRTITGSFVTGSLNAGDNRGVAYVDAPPGITGPLIIRHALQRLGGLCGYSDPQGTIADSYAQVAVRAGANRGGSVVTNVGNIYARADQYLAGFCGYNAGAISRCYSTKGVIAGGVYPTGDQVLVQERSGFAFGGTVLDSFWDTESSALETSGEGTGKTTAEMQTELMFTASGWDFENIWQMDGYPSLSALAGYPLTFESMAAPTFSPDSGLQLAGNIEVLISSPTDLPGTSVYGTYFHYTTDGGDPTDPDGWVSFAYPGYPISVPVPGTLRAYAIKEGMNPSEVVTAIYEAMPQVELPVIDPDGGVFVGESVAVVVTCATEGASIRYSIDGSNPSDASLVVAAGSTIAVPLPGILKVQGWLEGIAPSAIVTGEYQLAQVELPVIDPDGGVFAGESVAVVVTCATEGASIRYSIDGRDPSDASLVVAAGSTIAVPLPGILKVQAWREGMQASPTLMAAYHQKGPVTHAPYLVLDLSAGPSAESYPVSYLDAVPPGGWTDEYKTSKLVLRLIPAGTFTMGSPADELGRVAATEDQYEIMLTQDFYAGVFEVTQRQWERVMGGSWPSHFTNMSYREKRPLETRSWNHIRGGTWPGNPAGSGQPAAGSFVDRVRARTGMTFDLPTSAQWEYACRAGTTTALNSGKDLSDTDTCPHLSELGRYARNHPGGYSSDRSVDDASGTACVGSYHPNDWGLYDMHGNVRELCLDWHAAAPPDAIDPSGGESGVNRVIRGGSWNSIASNCRSASKSFGIPSAPIGSSVGFRLFGMPTESPHVLTVINGIGGGAFPAGTRIALSIDPIPVGQIFGRWVIEPTESDLGADFNPLQAVTTMTMPDHAVVLTALYTEPKTPDNVSVAWLEQHGLPTDGSADHTDPTGKGMTVREDYIADTCPTNANSVLRLREVSFSLGGITVEWQGGVLARQTLERATDLTQPNPWQPIFTNEPPTPIEAQYFDATPNGEAYFYRIVVERP